ncbi:Hypothetical protein CpOVI2C_01278 [Corynebacterium pseudotuberculosis]|nr:hypothetical protein CpphoP_1312 [Corynebacterium pseudotuberculosis]ATQ65687.1 Hypothetical protein CpPA07_1388 [Corynebacterium pseudotuberculosis]AUY07269.1 Hypothetical protein CpOVI2C_01278 [Corynebacterium pseudotuberculosis]AUY56454.1 Hypothetical protein CpCAP3W_01274 [Corynebacterium pseudotuberculosis]AUY58543.1 Hypothetical protein CpCAPJ4_01272 [Corynebacterium pseudotuberculosis]
MIPAKGASTGFFNALPKNLNPLLRPPLSRMLAIAFAP